MPRQDRVLNLHLWIKIGGTGGTGEGKGDEKVEILGEDADFWNPNLQTGADDLDKKVNIIASAVRTIGIIASVLSLSIIGIKFMLGSVEEKAQYKQTLIPWLIGAILVFAMTNLPIIIYEFTQGIFN